MPAGWLNATSTSRRAHTIPPWSAPCASVATRNATARPGCAHSERSPVLSAVQVVCVIALLVVTASPVLEDVHWLVLSTLHDAAIVPLRARHNPLSRLPLRAQWRRRIAGAVRPAGSRRCAHATRQPNETDTPALEDSRRNLLSDGQGSRCRRTRGVQDMNRVAPLDQLEVVDEQTVGCHRLSPDSHCPRKQISVFKFGNQSPQRSGEERLAERAPQFG